MTTSEKKAIQAKIFMGVRLTYELQNSLNSSVLWKQAQIDSPLRKISLNGKEYLGSYVEQELIRLDYLQQSETKIRATLSTFCPQLNLDKTAVLVFSQIFIR